METVLCGILRFAHHNVCHFAIKNQIETELKSQALKESSFFSVPVTLSCDWICKALNSRAKMLAPSFIFFHMKRLTWRHFFNIFIFRPKFDPELLSDRNINAHTYSTSLNIDRLFESLYFFSHLFISTVSHRICVPYFLVKKIVFFFVQEILCPFTKPNEVDHFLKHLTSKPSSRPDFSLCLYYSPCVECAVYVSSDNIN